MRSFAFQQPANSSLVEQLQKTGLPDMNLSFSHYTKTYKQETDTQEDTGDEGDIFHL